MTWLTDRSRIMKGLQNCPTARYWEFHFGPLGMGISSKGFSLALWTGIALHEMLESVLTLYKLAQDAAGRATIAPEAVDRSQIRIAIAESLKASVEAAKLAGFDEEANEFVLMEQSNLAEGLVWGWLRACLPKFLQDYEIVALEKELPIDLTAAPMTPLQLDIRLQTRPDLVLRSRATGKLLIADWKSLGSGRISDGYVQEYRTSVQMAVGTLATEKHFGEPVESYSIFVFCKGGREVFESRGVRSATKRNYSHLLYAKFKPPSPPLDNGSFELKGYWVDKQPSWEQEWLRADSSQSIMEAWVEKLPLETLYEMYAEIGPYPRQDYMATDFLEVLKGEELRWAKLSSQHRGGYPDSALIPKSYDCHSYGRQCSFYDLCFKIGDAWKDPLGSGKFKLREPHHADEELAFERIKKELDTRNKKA